MCRIHGLCLEFSYTQSTNRLEAAFHYLLLGGTPQILTYNDTYMCHTCVSNALLIWFICRMSYSSSAITHLCPVHDYHSQ